MPPKAKKLSKATKTSSQAQGNATRSRSPTTQRDDSGSSVTASSANTPEGSLQESVKSHLVEEVESRHIFSKTRDFIAHFSPQLRQSGIDYRAVIAKLSPTNETELDLYTLVPTWPPDGSSEEAYYPPFASFLTMIRSAVISLARPNGHQILPLKIFSYNKEMADKVHGSPSLKPDGLAAVKKKDKVTWAEVEFVFEVKENPGQAFPQCASYARAMFASRPGRRQAVVIYLDQKLTRAQVHVFNRSCVSSSLLLSLMDLSGIRNFIRIVAAFFTTIDEEVDSSQDSELMMLPDCLIQVQGIVSQRICVTGRSTHVISGKVIALQDRQTSEEKKEAPVVKYSSGMAADSINLPQITLPGTSRLRRRRPDTESTRLLQAFTGLSLETKLYRASKRHLVCKFPFYNKFVN